MIKTTRMAMQVYTDHIATASLVSDTVRTPEMFSPVARGLNNCYFAKTAKILNKASAGEVINASSDRDD
jgi:hypothetical protein